MGEIVAPATGEAFAVDLIADVNFPITKLGFGAPGTATDVTSGTPLPVALPPGASTAANQAAILAGITGGPFIVHGAAPVTVGTSITFKSLYIGAGGTVVITTPDGNTNAFLGVPIGFFPVAGTAVAAGTTAQNIIALN
jgi:hypothetical protein